MGFRRPLSEALRSFELAPFDDSRWAEAVKSLADATGSRAGQLIAWSGPSEVPGYTVSELNDGTVERWVELGGADPANNPIVAAGLCAQPLVALPDDAFMSDEDRRTNPLWPEFYDVIDLPRICIGTAWRSGSSHVVLAALRTRKQGGASPDEVRTFEKLLQAAGRAITITASLKGEAARIAAGALEMVGSAAFILNGFGRVVSVSEAAEEMLRKDDRLKLQAGELHASRCVDDLELQNLLRQARMQTTPERVHMRLEQRAGSALLIEAMRLPERALNIGFAAQVVVIVQPATERQFDADAALRRRFGLTPAEAQVAIALTEGQSPREVAQSRGTSLETVRTQVRTIYSKCGVRSHLGLAALIRTLR